MFAKVLHLIADRSSFTLCRLDIVFLRLEKVILPGCLSLRMFRDLFTSDFKVGIWQHYFEESLASVVLRPGFVLCVGPF